MGASGKQLLQESACDVRCEGDGARWHLHASPPHLKGSPLLARDVRPGPVYRAFPGALMQCMGHLL